MTLFPNHAAFTVTLAIKETALILIAVFVAQEPLSMHEVIVKVAIVFCSRRPDLSTATLPFPIDPLAQILGACMVLQESVTMFIIL